MNNRLTALHFAGEVSAQECSEAMKKSFAALFSSGGITYSQFLFPYVDSLLLSDDSTAPLFGTHALLWQVDAERLEGSIKEACGDDYDRLCPQISEIDASAGAAADFLGETIPADGTYAAGSYAQLLTGLVRPWSMREHSRGVCSFAEHIARMKGYEIHGFVGGDLIISAQDDIDKELLGALYESKTGGRLQIK